MELGPIFRALIYNRARFLLIAVEVALTLAIVVNCVHLISDLRSTMTKPSGLDEANLLTVEIEPFLESYRDEDFLAAEKKEDARLLRSLPGVRAATGIQSFPLSGGGSAASRKAAGSPGQSQVLPYFFVTEDAIETLGVELVAGRGFTEADFDAEENANVILSQALADRLFPDGGALGQQLTTSREDDYNTVVGIVRHMTNAWPESEVPDLTALFPGEPGNWEHYRFLVRAEPGAIDDLYTRIEEALVERNDGRVVNVATLAEVRAATFESSQVVVQMLTGVIFLLFFVTAVGIAGLTSFSVTERTKQIGTRRALGATRAAIVRYFLVENWLVTTTGLVLGVGASYALNYALMSFATDGTRLSWQLLALGSAVLWTSGLAAATLPALRGSRVAPVIATRYV